MAIRKYETENKKVEKKYSKSGSFVSKSSKIILRIIDANLNRCREGLRVVEDSLRFVVDDETLYKRIRNIRHDIGKILREIYPKLVKERSSFEDPGRRIREVSKKELQVVIISNFKRAQESMRVLEEYSKIFWPVLSSEFKKCRYATYTAEKLVYMKYKNIFTY